MVTFPGYAGFALSSTGASHVTSGTLCQDYSLHFKDSNAIIIAVADGHGSPDHFLSDRGSRFACECAVSCIRRLVDSPTHASGHDLENIQHEIVRTWRQRVEQDWSGIDHLSKSPYVNIWKDLGKPDPVTVYGTTLIAAALTRHYWFGIQIGDGKCVVLCTNGEWIQPIPWDERCFLNATTSICEKGAAGLFRSCYHTELPAAIFIGSDGVDNAYPLEKNEWYLAGLYQKILGTFSAEGIKNGTQQLRDFLPLFSAKGSGDDVSIAGIMYHAAL